MGYFDHTYFDPTYFDDDSASTGSGGPRRTSVTFIQPEPTDDEAALVLLEVV